MLVSRRAPLVPTVVGASFRLQDWNHREGALCGAAPDAAGGAAWGDLFNNDDVGASNSLSSTTFGREVINSDHKNYNTEE